MIEHERDGERFAADDALAAGFADAGAPEPELVARGLDIVRPLADKERGIFRALESTLWGDVARALGVDLTCARTPLRSGGM